MFKIKIPKLNLFSGGAKGEVVGVNLGASMLKLAYARISPNKKEVVKLANSNIAGLSDQELSNAIRASFNELGAKSPGIINILPSNLVITKNIEIPSIEQQEIKEIINLQAGRHTPYAREEIIVDYIDIGTYKNNYTKVLLVIVSRNVIKRHFEILDRAGLKLERVLLAPESLACAVPKILGLATEVAPVSIAHIDEEFTDFGIVFRSKIVFIRPIAIGAQHLIAEKERYQMRFAEEIKRSLEAYQAENIEKGPNTLILTGAVEELKELETLLNSNLSLPAKIMPYFGNLTISQAALKTASLVKYSSFLNVIAPLLALEEMKADLIPEEIKLRKSLEERGGDLIKTGIFILAIFVLIALILISKIYFKSAYLNSLNNKYQSLNQDAGKLEKDFSQVSLIKEYLSNRGYSLEVLTELYNIVPLELELGDIRFDEQGRITLKGTAESMSVVFSFVDNLGQSKYFKDVKTKYTSKRKAKDKDVTDFEIATILNKPG